MGAMSASRGALKAIRVSEKGLPETWPECQRALEARKRFVRNTRIFIEYLEADDKEAVIPVICERWGLQPGRIAKIIKDGLDGDKIHPLYASRVAVLRLNRTIETLRDFDNYRAEIEGQITVLNARRLGGETMGEVKIVDRTGKNAGIQTEKLPINECIRCLRKELAQSHQDEGSALSQYIPKPAQQHEHTGAVVHLAAASDDFRTMFDRMEGFSKTNEKAVDADYVVAPNSDSGD